MTRILFLGERGAARTPMAAAFARARAPADVEVLAAALAPAEEVDRLVKDLMTEKGLGVSETPAPALTDVDLAAVDVVVGLMARERAPRDLLLPGTPPLVCWDVDGPRSGAGEAPAWRAVRDTIERLVDTLFSRGYLASLAETHGRMSLILESLREGIIAHDLDRRIMYFNSAAETITGYTRAQVLGRDCHEVFGGPFCGPQCRFCTKGDRPEFDATSYPVSFTTRDGEARELEMTMRAIRNGDGALVGVLAAFRDLTREHTLARRLGEKERFHGIIGRDKKMLEVFELVRKVAEVNVPVLIQGESGTGKELVAAAIHNEGRRARGRFVPVHCGALPEGLLESELFGHVRGAFTGASRDKKGRFELADGGTIFLDEIGDVSPAMQVKLLRVLQEGKFERVGGTRTQQVDVRVISATNRDLGELINRGRFREDLYYRLCVVPLTLPPLRERCGDIPLLIDYIAARIGPEAGRSEITVTPAARQALLSHDWPGNVRELQNALQFAMVKAQGEVVDLGDLPPHILRAARDAGPVGPRRRLGRRGLDVADVRRAIREANGNKTAAARALGVGRATLYRFLAEHPEASGAGEAGP